MAEDICVKNLSKVFVVDKSNTFFEKIFVPKKQIVQAVNNISFNVTKGEIVGFIGPNGAGKSTTIKMLTGILVPTSGEICICGMNPYKERKQYVSNIGVVFGQRSQLWWDLPVKDSFDILKKTYKVNDYDYKTNLEIFDEILKLGKLMETPVRQLSLGQRMRCEVAAAFLHNPQIIFLDEPTIGLDLLAKENIISFIKKINEERETTILLTTHDLSDIEKLCKRIIIIDDGQVVFDNNKLSLTTYFDDKRKVMVELQDPVNITDKRIHIVEDNGIKKTLEINLKEISLNELFSLITQSTEIKDLKIGGNSIEDIIKKLYGGIR